MIDIQARRLGRVLISALISALLFFTATAGAITHQRATQLHWAYMRSRCGNFLYRCSGVQLSACVSNHMNQAGRPQWTCWGYVFETHKDIFSFAGPRYRNCIVASGWTPWGYKYRPRKSCQASGGLAAAGPLR